MQDVVVDREQMTATVDGVIYKIASADVGEIRPEYDREFSIAGPRGEFAGFHGRPGERAGAVRYGSQWTSDDLWIAWRIACAWFDLPRPCRACAGRCFFVMEHNGHKLLRADKVQATIDALTARAEAAEEERDRLTKFIAAAAQYACDALVAEVGHAQDT